MQPRRSRRRLRPRVLTLGAQRCPVRTVLSSRPLAQGPRASVGVRGKGQRIQPNTQSSIAPDSAMASPQVPGALRRPTPSSPIRAATVAAALCVETQDGVSSLKRRASSALVPTFAVETAKVKFQSRCTNKKDLNSQVASRRCPPLAPRRPECQSHAAPLRGARIVLRPSSATGEPSCAPFRAAGEHVSDTTLSLKPQQVLQGEILRTPSPARYLSLSLGCA